MRYDQSLIIFSKIANIFEQQGYNSQTIIGLYDKFIEENNLQDKLLAFFEKQQKMEKEFEYE